MPRAAVAAHGLRRGDAALRLRPPRPALRPRDRRRLATRCAAASSRSSSRCSAAAAWCARSTPARARCRARSSTGSTRSSSATAARRSPGRFVEDGGDGARRSRSSSGEDRMAAAVERAAARPRATCCCSSPTSRDVAAEALGALRLELGRRFGLIPEGGHDVLWVVDFPMFEPTEDERLGRAAPPVHRADGRLRRSRARCARAATTSSSTAGSSAAARSASTRPRSSSRSSRSSAWARRRRRRRFGFLLDALQATARRRTAASRWASTASSR